MMQYSFPYPARVQSSVPTLHGLRHEPFVNIDGESFAKPAMSGFWRTEMRIIARDVQAQMALSAFLTAMSGAAECVVPICVQWRPNDGSARPIPRPLVRGGVAPEYLFDHTGFANDPFDGFTLAAPASHRDSYIDVSKPVLSQLWPGHFITLGDRLHQVVDVSAIDEREDRIRVSVMPSIRGGYPAGEIVIVDQLRLRCRMESGDQIGFGLERMKGSEITFIEAF